MPKLLIADGEGRIYDVPYLEATGMKGGEYFRLKSSEIIELHPDSELFMLPDRNPVGFDPDSGQYVELKQNPLAGDNSLCYAVAAFLAPGHTATHSASLRKRGKTRMLPLLLLYSRSFVFLSEDVEIICYITLAICRSGNRN